MTTLLTTQDVARIVAIHGLPTLLKRLVHYLEADFRRWPEFDKTARVASHSRDGVIELMPIADAALYSFKYVNGHPKNTRAGLPTVMAFGVLADVATGRPELLSELTLTTAMRTAATSVMAARLLARPGSRTMALIGNGAQSEFQALAFHHLLGITELRLYDIDPRATAKLQRNLGAVPGLKLVACASTADAVAGADIVTTVTADKANATILTPAMLRPGLHINGVGGDCPGKTELHPDVLHAAKVFVEYEPQSRVEGDLQQMPADFPVHALWQVMTGEVSGRDHDAQITVFDSVGFALEDYSALRLLRDCARELGLGEPVDITPSMADP
ncbi:ornithine cyclodeaminase, partial [Aquabacterium sp.]|uniref:ornithine cyclodeaminase n=1 Tax=Aquabacterium sp. TaxID=1872578 RepID=UPI0037851280